MKKYIVTIGCEYGCNSYNVTMDADLDELQGMYDEAELCYAIAEMIGCGYSSENGDILTWIEVTDADSTHIQKSDIEAIIKRLNQ